MPPVRHDRPLPVRRQVERGHVGVREQRQRCLRGGQQRRVVSPRPEEVATLPALLVPQRAIAFGRRRLGKPCPWRRRGRWWWRRGACRLDWRHRRSRRRGRDRRPARSRRRGRDPAECQHRPRFPGGRAGQEAQPVPRSRRRPRWARAAHRDRSAGRVLLTCGGDLDVPIDTVDRPAGGEEKLGGVGRHAPGRAERRHQPDRPAVVGEYAIEQLGKLGWEVGPRAGAQPLPSVVELGDQREHVGIGWDRVDRGGNQRVWTRSSQPDSGRDVPQVRPHLVHLGLAPLPRRDVPEKLAQRAPHRLTSHRLPPGHVGRRLTGRLEADARHGVAR